MSTNNKPQNEQTYYNWQNGLTDSFRDLLGIQLRTTQAVMDKTIGLGQALTDYLQTQVSEGMKLSQHYVKYGWSITENFRKSATEATDRAFHTTTG